MFPVSESIDKQVHSPCRAHGGFFVVPKWDIVQQTTKEKKIKNQQVYKIQIKIKIKTKEKYKIVIETYCIKMTSVWTKAINRLEQFIMLIYICMLYIQIHVQKNIAEKFIIEYFNKLL